MATLRIQSGMTLKKSTIIVSTQRTERYGKVNRPQFANVMSVRGRL